ncbi:4,5-DOPA dioxygenase extradiol [Pseudomonas sp. 8O]|nr:4,5-DOPA dioxygenase extradiol [Pseudomonas sp. 8O]
MLEIDRSSNEDDDILLQELIAMLPSLFISHGSPMLALDPGASGPALARLAAELPRPKAIVVVSAHWESQRLLLTAGEHPKTWHDFGGFPAALYTVQYPAPGAPELAAKIAGQLNEAGLPAELDAQRPFDHGAWVPLSLMYPQADIPVLQLSLPSRMGPELQTRIGRALADLREQGVLLIGSGSITHNLGELDWRAGPDVITPWAKAFRDWVVEKLEANDEEALHHYRHLAPSAVRNHPSDEHLLPLFFARGAGGAFKVEHSGFTYGALGMDIYRFG